jgi:transposase
VERFRTHIARAYEVPQGRPPSGFEPGLSPRNYLCPQERTALESPASRNGLWKRRNLLAAIAGMDQSGGLAGSASPIAPTVGKARLASAVSGGDRQCINASCFWGVHTGPNPTDRRKKGSKRHVITDARGVPLVVQIGPANEPDGKRALKMLDQIPAVAGRRGRPRRKPTIFQGDAAYGTAAIIEQVRQRRIQPLLALYGHQKRQHGSGLGRTRYVVERTLSWFGNFRRIKLCYERTASHLQAFHELAAALICFKKLQPRDSKF